MQFLTIPKVCPICGGPTSIKISDSGTKILVCDNPQCNGKLIQRLDHYCSTKGLNIKGLSLATLNKLYDWGWLTNLFDLYNLSVHKQEWISKEGFGEKSVQKILDAIENSKNCELYQFIAGLGIPLIGLTVAKEICKYYPTWTEFRAAVGGSWLDLPGFGPEMESAINKFDYTEADKIAEVLVIKQKESTPVTPLNKASAADLTFCVTGSVNHFKNRNELISYIESIGGKAVSSVSSKVNYLINNDITSKSSKNLKAKELNIEIISEEKFLEKFGQK